MAYTKPTPNKMNQIRYQIRKWQHRLDEVELEVFYIENLIEELKKDYRFARLEIRRQKQKS